MTVGVRTSSFAQSGPPSADQTDEEAAMSVFS